MAFKIIPDNYATDPQGWLANQGGHMALGAVVAICVCFAHLQMFGEFPYRVPTWLSIMATYIAFELRTQRWQGADTVEDAVFVGVYGAGSVLYVFREVNAGTGDFAGNIYDFLPFLLAGTFHIVVGFSARVMALRGVMSNDD